MYKDIFDHKSQKELDNCFLEALSGCGMTCEIKKGEIINPDSSNYIFLVLEGEVNQLMYSKDGNEIIFFRITKGSIFGEEDFFDEKRTSVIYKALQNSTIKMISKNEIDIILESNPKLFRCFLQSMVIKNRMIMMEISNYKFNDSEGKLADFLIRLYYTEDINMDMKKHISIVLTHEEIANRIGLNRTTVTKIMNKFKEEDYITISGKEIIINDIEALKSLTNIPI